MTDIFKIGFEADVKQIKQVDSALDGMAVAADNADEKLDGLNDELTRNAKITPKVTKASNGATGAVKKGAKAFKLQKGAMQQAGYQVQDFSVQMAGGTKFLTAFGQQASQLAGVLRPRRCGNWCNNCRWFCYRWRFISNFNGRGKES